MKRLKHGAVFLGTFIFIAISFAIELHYIRLETVSIPARILLLLLLNLTIIALLTLMFFVGKNLAKLFIERKQKILGYKFKTKIVVIFVVLTLIPSAVLFFIASGIVTNYIDKLLTPQFKQPLSSSLEVAKTIYDMERQKTADFARSVMSGEKYSSEYKISHISKLPEDPTETLKNAFEGKEGTEVISGENGDIIRAALPEYTAGKLTGIMTVETHLPRSISVNVEKIKTAHEDFLKLESWKTPLKINYLLILSFFTLIVVFMSLWVALKLTKDITDPIQSLAQATEEVAAGNLDISVDLRREDEIGLLITSFNHMIRGLKEGKETLQQAYLESDRRRLWLENILANINSGVVFLDIPGTILTINNSACTILNIKHEDIVGKNYRELISMINSEELNAMIKGIVVKDLKSIEKEVTIPAGDKRIILRVFVTGLRDIGSTLIGLLVVFDDLTEVIKAKENLVWEEATRRIAHEIKNPLTPIKLSTERMIKKWEQKDKDFDQVFERSAKTIVKEVDSLKRLIDEYSRLGKMPEIKKAPAAIPVILNEILELYHDHKEFDINISMPDNIPLIDMDSEQFKRVLINIFENAFQAMGNSGRIELSSKVDIAANKILFYISDNGPGISEEDKAKIFLPYFSTKKGGTGLGLAIANKIIKGHNGTVRVKDNMPRGTTFIIEMPIKAYEI